MMREGLKPIAAFFTSKHDEHDACLYQGFVFFQLVMGWQDLLGFLLKKTAVPPLQLFPLVLRKRVSFSQPLQVFLYFEQS